MFRSHKKWDMGMDITPEDEPLNTTKYQEVLQKSAQNEYGAKHRQLPVTEPETVPMNNLFPSAVVS